MVSLALLAGHASAFAQSEEENSRPLWGVRAALDINLPGKWHGDAGSVKMFRHGFGGTLGAVCNVYLGKGFYLEPGVSLFYDTYSYYDLTLGADPDDMSTTVSDPPIYKIGLRIPVVAGYTFDISDRFSMAVYTGPELSYAFAGGIRHTDNIPDAAPLSPFGKEGGQRRVDCAWKVGIGFPFSSWMFSVDAAFGMTDLLKSDMSFRENRVTLGLTRYF